MHHAHIDDHSHIRPRDVGQIGNLAEMAHTHFQHSHFRIFGHSQNGHGHAQIIVEIGRCLADDKVTVQHRGDHFLGGAFAHRAGDTHHLHADALPLGCGNTAQSDPGIVHDNGRIAFVAMLAQRRGRSLLERSGKKIMAVPDTLQRYKQLPRHQGAGIIGGAQEQNLFKLRIYPATAPIGSLPECDLTHTLFSVSANQAATASRSSK